MASVSARGLGPLAEVRAGDDLAQLIAATPLGAQLHDGQLIVIAHKAVSKSEGAVAALTDIVASERARERRDSDERAPERRGQKHRADDARDRDRRE